MKIRVSWYTVTNDLGPGRRFALWLQGCHKRCRGCISPSFRDMDGGKEYETDDILRMILDADVSHVTISGGEPFLQSEALADILTRLRQQRDVGVICYTGYKYEEIASDPLAGLVDLLIDGEYVEELDDGLPMRGSSNQRLIYLTDRYTSDDLPKHRTSTAFFEDENMILVGIPSKGAKEFLDMVRSDTDD